MSNENLSETSSDNDDTIPLISDDEEHNESEDNNINEGEEWDVNDNEEDNDNENDDKEENDDERNSNDEENDGNKGRPLTSDVWEFVDKTTRKCPSCSKIFGKKTGTSSIRTHLKTHGILLIKEKQ